MEVTDNFKLFMILLGCKPNGRHTEQHDIFFAVGRSIADLKAEIVDFWPEAEGKLHIDAWREVTVVDGYQIQVVPNEQLRDLNAKRLFFINLGGYRKNEFDEPHYKMLVVADALSEATQVAKETAFYKHTGFDGAVSHIDDKYGIDVDDVFNVADVLPATVKDRFAIHIEAAASIQEDALHLGYLPLSKL